MGPVVGVGVTDVEGQVVVRVRVHLTPGHRVEPLRGLPVAALALGAELAGPAADRERLDEDVAGRSLLPDFDLRFLLVGPEQHRRCGRDALLGHQREGRGRDRRLGLAGLRDGGAGDGQQGEAGGEGDRGRSRHEPSAPIRPGWRRAGRVSEVTRQCGGDEAAASDRRWGNPRAIRLPRPGAVKPALAQSAFAPVPARAMVWLSTGGGYPQRRHSLLRNLWCRVWGDAGTAAGLGTGRTGSLSADVSKLRVAADPRRSAMIDGRAATVDPRASS